jgi:hypothetical protein
MAWRGGRYGKSGMKNRRNGVAASMKSNGGINQSAAAKTA